MDEEYYDLIRFLLEYREVAVGHVVFPDDGLLRQRFGELTERCSHYERLLGDHDAVTKKPVPL
jgi:hypothetical protein